MIMTLNTAPIPAALEEPASLTVDAVMGQLVTELGASLGVLLTDLGLRSGIWQAMAGAGPLGIEEIAAASGVSVPIIREWVRSQSAAGYVHYDPDTDRYELPEAVAIALLAAPGGATVSACVELLQSMMSQYDDFAHALATDGRFGWHQRNFHYWHGTDRLTQAQLPAEVITAAIEAMDSIGATLTAGGTVLDVGSGFGFPTVTIAERYPASTVLGIDYHAGSVAAATERAVHASLADRVSFQTASATDLPGADYTLITYFDSLHDFGEPVEALRAARSVLAPGGAVLVCDNDAADRVADNLNPMGRMYYAVSTLVCTPNALSQHGPNSPEPLGTYAGAGRIAAIAQQAGFSRVRRLDVPGAMNLFLDLRP
jgi:SAM-dependent methyltransferase